MNAQPVTTLEEIVNQTLWNNKFICIGQKSVFNRKLFSLGLHKVGDLFNEICIKQQTTLQNLNALDMMLLKGLHHSLPAEWKKAMSSDPASVLIKTEPPTDDVLLYSNDKTFLLAKISSREIYNVLVSKRSITPTAKKKYDEDYSSECDLNWEFIYSNAFKCAIDTKTREFQYKILNRILPLNVFLFKIGKIDSPLCTFCQSSEETMYHLFFSCPLVSSFWHSIKHLLEDYEINGSEVIFGITKAVENALLKNHVILISKQYIFRCRLNGSLPYKVVFNQHLKAVYESESLIAKRKNKLQFHNEKWKKLMPYLSQI